MDNIEDIYYNKYLKYKYKYLELKGKGNGILAIIQENIEKKFYGPELLEEIKSITKTNDIDNDIWTRLWSSLFTGNIRVYEINLIDNFENSLIKILEKISEKISKKEKLTAISTDINLIIDKIKNNKIQESNLRMTNYFDIEIFINNVFEKHILLKTYSKILKKLFNIYFKFIKFIKEQKK